ncbi:hypothetical protein DPMN_055779 [Dreissena polymorpha]|uniref:Uncharacterized protein n=1 Tax=Dreissena polymorpha TaxID=45954 RepID=A0A9D4CTA3_DREPO|nr:hypothetical protein DPMN_055779 [Dreissena polymorpha]
MCNQPTNQQTIRQWGTKKCPAPGGHVFKATKTIFKLIQDIIGTNPLTKIHDDWKINVASTPFWKNAPPYDSHVFQAKVTIFKLIQDIIGTNLLTKFHEDRKLNVAARVLTRKNSPPLAAMKNAPPLGKNTCSDQKFHEDWTTNVTSRVFTCFHYIHIEKTAPPLCGHVFSPIWTIFELDQDSNETNVSNKFHDDWAKIVTSRVFTRNTAPPPGGHVFQRTGTIFELTQHII